MKIQGLSSRQFAVILLGMMVFVLILLVFWIAQRRINDLEWTPEKHGCHYVIPSELTSDKQAGSQTKNL